MKPSHFSMNIRMTKDSHDTTRFGAKQHGALLNINIYVV